MTTPDKNNAAMPILIIEDEEKVHEVLALQAQKEGLDFTFAKNGREGIGKLRSAPPASGFAAVLLDLHMPESDGFWFLEEKKKDPALANIPVTVFTNLSSPDLIKRALALGVKGYMIKAHHSIQNVISEVKKCAGGETCSVDWH